MVPDQGGRELPEDDPEEDDQDSAGEAGELFIHGRCLLEK